MQWDAHFFRKTPLFWPIERAAKQLSHLGDWPSVDELALALGAGLPVQFESPRPRPRRAPVAPDERYDARIALAGRVPTRTRVWHDLLNALVWASFPRAKAALHTRQHRMIRTRLDDTLRLPGARTKEQDAVAMLDEGGLVLVCDRAARDALLLALEQQDVDRMAQLVCADTVSAVIFGHAIYESLACDSAARVRSAVYVVEVDALASDRLERVAVVDRALAALLERPTPLSRADFASLQVDERLAGGILVDHASAVG